MKLSEDGPKYGPKQVAVIKWNQYKKLIGLYFIDVLTERRPLKFNLILRRDTWVHTYIHVLFRIIYICVGYVIKLHSLHPVVCIISCGYDRLHNNKVRYIRVTTKTDIYVYLI
jgi:hypothetical protein